MKITFTQFNQYLRLAIRALKANLVRSLLTTLGIVIGIMTVIVVFSLGRATERVIEGELEGYGANLVIVEVKVPGFSDNNPAAATAMVEGITITTLKEDDMEAALDIPGVIDAYAGVIGLERAVSIYDDQQYMIQATSASFIDIDQSQVEFGRYFTEAEDQSLSRVAVLGYSAAQELFPDVDPLGQTIRIRNVNFKVIGVMKEMGVVFFQDMDDQIYLPVNTMQKLIMGVDYLPYFVVQVENEEIAPLVKADIVEMLDYRHNINGEDKRDFRVTTMEEAMDMMAVITDTLGILLLVLAAISLVVGGVGVMNVMFVVVSERTREIGLRKAVGASQKAILLQFLFESIVVTAAGGIIGVIAGLGFVYLAILVAQFGGIEVEFSIPIEGVVIAVSAAILEGILFGLYPAQKAAKLNPIESLRFE